MPDHGREGCRRLPGEGFQLQGAQRNPLAGARGLDHQPRAVPRLDAAYLDFGEFVGDHDRRAIDPRFQPVALLRRSNGGKAVLLFAFPFEFHRNMARFCIRMTASSTMMVRRASCQPEPVRRSRSSLPADTVAASRTSPRLRNSRTAESTMISSGLPVRKVRTLVT